MRTTPVGVRVLPVAAALLFVTATAGAQGPAVTNPPNTQEFGIDAAALFGLGDQSSIGFQIPAARARIGFFLNENSRFSVEPAAGLAYSKVEDVPYLLTYNFEVGILYHFRPHADVYNATRATVAYTRPFLGFVGTKTGGDDGSSDSEVSLGAGLGIKVPWRAGLAWRLEGNAGYGFDNEAFRLGAFIGVSFFARSLIPTGG